MATAVEKYNNFIHSVTRKTPKEIVFGRNSTAEDPEELERIRKALYDEVLVQLKSAQEKQKERNKHLKDKLIKPKHKNRFKKIKV